ncbi:MAG: DNA polymerase III subunit delta [Lachnospiraceae bacterium]|nr:DNA polymerase III subunit delta [Lachnospiraceae bacterium]
MQQITQDIENRSFKRCYLLYGDEDYLRKQYKDKLVKALCPDGDTMNFNRYEGKDIDIDRVIDQAETMPFFADKRLILIEDSGLCKSGGEKLADYLGDSSPDTVIILNESSVDKRSRLFKAAGSNGRAVEFTRQSEETLKKWILGRVRKEKKNIDARALENFLEKTGDDMMTINNELEKLFSYVMNKDTITADDVDRIITVSTSSKVFDMIAAMAEKKQSKALDMYHDLLVHKETPFGILALITRQFNMMLQVYELKDDGHSSSHIAKAVGIPPFVEAKYEKQLKNFTYSRLRKALRDCAAADEAVKIKGMNPELSVELLIIEHSGV